MNIVLGLEYKSNKVIDLLRIAFTFILENKYEIRFVDQLISLLTLTLSEEFKNLDKELDEEFLISPLDIIRVI